MAAETIDEIFADTAEMGRLQEGILRDASASQVAEWVRVLSHSEQNPGHYGFVLGLLMGGRLVHSTCERLGMDDLSLRLIFSAITRAAAEAARQVEEHGAMQDMSDEMIESINLATELEVYRMYGAAGDA